MFVLFYVFIVLLGLIEGPDLYQNVNNLMINGPCGLLNTQLPSMKDGHCETNYPK